MSYKPNATIYLCLAHMSEEGWEQQYIKEAFDTNWVVPLGPNVNAFEKDLEDYFSNKDEKSTVVALCSGTSAVHLALIACGVQPGDEVLVQSFTFCASSHPIKYLGATPIFIDSEPNTWNMDPALLEEAIKDRIAKTGKKPKAIVPVALYGMPYDCERIMEIANRYDIPVVEDAAEGFGSRFGVKALGTYGKFGVLSFNGNKMITTSGGGALICHEEEDKNTIMWYATQARDAYPYYQHTAIGYNYRLSNVCAGIGRGQMKIVNDHIAHHKHVCELYAKYLCGAEGNDVLYAEGAVIKSKFIPGLALHVNPADSRYDSNFWLCTATLEADVKVVGQENVYKEVIKTAVGGAAGVIKEVESATTDCQPNDNIEALRVFMLDKKVEARPLWKPMHKQPVYADCPAYTNGVSEEIFKKGICLPAGPCVTDDDVRYIAECIKEAIVR
ncbi:MAG: aminotransferase class I/II-fold pyridoxal phosphate-dependent enzyme [Prevotella sp.]|nr:aminotransferase class I/II-fold pyridoxal phosphate-dependent enzyme [Prevotella sp.]